MEVRFVADINVGYFDMEEITSVFLEIKEKVLGSKAVQKA